MILLIDNYDSFVHNLARYFRRLGVETRIERNDSITPEQVGDIGPSAIVISPGPCTPSEAGVSLEILRRWSGEIPILGVCLGHQAIVMAMGGSIGRATQPMHGRVSTITHSGDGLFLDIPSPLTVCRYHSLEADRDTLPDCLAITAETEDRGIMAIEHQQHPTLGVQFHPEAILTEFGDVMLANFLRMVR